MLNKINKEINEFTSSIKEVRGCEEMLTYMNSNISSCIKLLMFASKTFSLYARVLLFFIIAITGLLIFSTVSLNGLNIGLLVITIVLFILTIAFIMSCRSYLILSIKNSKSKMEETQKESIS